MGFWPFGGGKRQRTVEVEDHGRETLLRRTPSDSMTQQEKTGQSLPNAGQVGNKNGREENRTRRLSKPRNQDSRATQYTQPATIRTENDTRRTSRTESQYNEKGLYQQNPLSQSSLGPENFTVVPRPPTLHAKRSETESNLPRRKSSKRKAEDFAREREIRAMSSSPIPIPKRPATLYGSGPLQRDSRQVPGSLNRRLERPTSEISLPFAGSLPDVVDYSNQNSFKVGILAALSPRPTVRYDANPKQSTGKQPLRPNLAIQRAIEEEDVSDKKRIDELADDLDAGGLRELMERDRRRRERKKEADKAKLQRRLQRRADRQREEEARRARTEAFVQSSPTDAQQTPDLSVESAKQVQDPSVTALPANLHQDDPFRDPGPSTIAGRTPIRNPFDDEKDVNIMDLPIDSDQEVVNTGTVPVLIRSPPKHIDLDDARLRERQSQSTLSPPVSPVNRAVDRSSMSQGSLLNRATTPDIPENASLERRASTQSSQKLSSWTTFFRRGTRRSLAGAPGRTTPEFSNTSRESFSRKQQPPPVVAPRTFRRSDSATPQRTLSRFREDLPELPISPPDSRVQSPEASAPPVRSSLISDAAREQTPSLANTSSLRDSSGIQVAEQIEQSQRKRSADLDVPLSATAGMLLSQSLASVDSEGSWLSGKPMKRQSGQLSYGIKPSQSSLRRQIPGAFEREGEDEEEAAEEDDEDESDDGEDNNDNDDDDNFMDEDYYKQSSQPSVAGQVTDRLQTAQGRASSTIVDPGSEQSTAHNAPGSSEVPTLSQTSAEKWYSSIGRQPTLIKQVGRAKSKEGLLKNFTSAEEGEVSSNEAANDNDSDPADVDTKETPLLRARSVEYKGHIRHMSAGSAKLLDIKRSSIAEQSRPQTAATTQTSEAPLQPANTSSNRLAP